MKSFFIVILSSFLWCMVIPSYAQFDFDLEQDTTPDQVLLERQWSLGALLHTNGWGLKFRKGKNITALRQFMWELEWSTYKSPKEIKQVNPYYSDSRAYIYGKLNYLSFLRGGVGFQHILNRKPYWGGIQLSWIYSGGISLGLTKPSYLYIIHTINDQEFEIVEERYDPDVHNIDYIYGRGSFLAGILELGFYPGIYLKTGLDFEYGARNKALSSLEVGTTFDVSPIAIPIMAYNPKQRFFLTIYISFTFGKRYNK
jgi:hypothetical protein